MINKIFLRQVLKEMEKIGPDNLPVKFSIEVRTFNSQNKEGGRLVKYTDASLLVKPAKKKKAFNPMEHLYRVERDRKNPNHWSNRTRNIQTKSGQIKKLKILYITKFNGLEVVY